MSVRVSAVVISHDQPEWLRKTLTALESQTRPVDEIIAVDTSLSAEAAAIFEEFKISPVIRRTDTSMSALIAAGASQAASTFTTPNLVGESLAPLDHHNVSDAETQRSWFWLLHDDSAPEPDALEKLLAAADLSPSVALLGPKHLDPEKPNLIVQQGFTLTRLGGIFSLVDRELDQAQYDDADDVLAISTAGALVRADLYRRLQGFDRHAPNLASDIDFSIRARISGYRVVVVPAARLLHATLSLNGKRSRRWMPGGPDAAKRRAEIHLQLAYLPASIVWLYALLLPANGFIRALWRVASKNPNLAATELSAAFWGFFTIPIRLLSRAKVDLNRDISLKALLPLRASWSMVRDRNRMLLAQVEDDFSASSQVAIESFQNTPNATGRRFAGAGGWFIALALVISSWQFWPTGIAAIGGSFAPLSSDWFKLAGRAGSSWQYNGLGLAAPSDPINWLLTAIGGLWFVTPSLALATAVLLARSFAFIGAWHAAGLTTKRAWIRNLLAISYALWPSLLAAQQQARIGAILTWMALPWLVLAVSKLFSASVGRRARARQASWIGISGLLFAAVAVAAPSVSLVLLLSLAVMAAVRPKRAAVLIWVPVLGAVLFAPYAWFMLPVPGRSFVLLSDPGLPLDSAAQSFWQVFAGLPNGLTQDLTRWGSWQWLELWPALLAIAAFCALFAKRALVALALVGFAVVAAALGFVVQGTWFASLEVHGSAAAATAVVAICLLLAAGLGLDSIAQNHKKFAGIGASFALVALLAASLGSFGLNGVLLSNKPIALSFSDGRTVPAIVAAEAAQGSHLRLLKIMQQAPEKFVAKLVSPEGLQLESNSTAYRLVLAQESASQPKYLAINALVANLVSANGSNLNQALAAANIGFVLVPEANSADLNSALNSVSELDLVGQTEFGWLWRVKAAKDNQPSDSTWRQTWSFTKGIQLLFILVFVLLAIPGPPKRRTKNVGTIFEANDFAESDFSESEFTDSEPIEGSSSPESERS
jgi:GT2 family glycosyltransferase